MCLFLVNLCLDMSTFAKYQSFYTIYPYIFLNFHIFDHVSNLINDVHRVTLNSANWDSNALFLAAQKLLGCTSCILGGMWQLCGKMFYWLGHQKIDQYVKKSLLHMLVMSALVCTLYMVTLIKIYISKMFSKWFLHNHITNQIT